MKVGPREASLPSGQVAEPSVNLAPRRFVLGNPRSQLKCTTRADPAIQRARFGSSHPAILAPHETAADNAACVGRRETSPTRAAVWAAREPLGVEARAAFRAEVLRQQQGQAPAAPTEAEVTGGEASDKACPWRVVLRRALVALGYLVFSWRRIPLQVRLQKTAKIT